MQIDTFKVEKDTGINYFLPILVLVAVAIGCYLPSLASGFMGDDYFAYSYFFKVLHTQPLLLLKNFTGSWMSSELRELYYRPLMIIPHLFDCLTWRLNPIGYHLTNLIIHSVCTVLCFLIARNIFKSLNDGTSSLAAFLAALLFAVHPLHAEVVSWIAGRVDGFCTMLYLSSFYLFLHSRQFDNRYLKIGSYVCAFGSMMCKESGTVLPAVFTFYIFCERFGTERITTTISHALKDTSIYWGSLLLYLALRTYALKTLLGGYSGLTGVLTGQDWLLRITDIRSYEKIFLPIPFEMSEKNQPYLSVASWLNCILAGACLVRLWVSKPNKRFARVLAFLLGWIAIQFAVVCRVWIETPSLAGGRQFYLLSAPYCILVALLLLPLSEKKHQHKILNASAASIMILYCSFFALISFQQNQFWTDAAAYSNTFRDAVINQYNQEPKKSHGLIVNIPVTYRHIGLYPSFEVLRGLFSWPFCNPDLTDHINSLQPYFYNHNLINKSALNTVLQDNNTKVICWNGNKKTTTVLAYLPPEGPNSSNCHLSPVPEAKAGLVYRVIPTGPIKKQNIDCLEITVRCKSKEKQNSNPSVLILSWLDNTNMSNRPQKEVYLWRISRSDGKLVQGTADKEEQLATGLGTLLESDENFHTYRFQLSEISSWALFGNLDSLKLMFADPSLNYDIKWVKLLNLSNEIPTLSLKKPLWIRNQNGSYATKDKLVFQYDATKIKGAQQVIVEISSPDIYWEYFSGMYRQQELSSRKLNTLTLHQLSGEFSIDNKMFPRDADYQIHIAALNASGQVIGYVSDPVIIHVKQQ